MRHLCFVGAGVALAFGLSGTAHAVTQTRVTQIPAGAACQLSVPTIDTAVRPRATGFRNEGTTSAFTICGIQDPVGGMVTDAAITLLFAGQRGAHFQLHGSERLAGLGTLRIFHEDRHPEFLQFQDIAAFLPRRFQWNHGDAQ